MKTAEISNIGAIERITIPLPETGGLVIFRGQNGSGKSTALDTIDSAVGAKRKVPVRDGTLKGGFEGLGITMTIGKSRQCRGEAEVTTLEGRFDIADLVDPGIAAPDKADAHRVKALVALVGAKADPSLFYEIVGGAKQFDAIASEETAKTDDLLLMAARFKRDLEAISRQFASEAANFKARADAARKAAEGDFDLSAETDAKKLQAEFEAKVREKQRIESAIEERQKAVAAQAKAKQELEKAVAAYQGPSAKDAKAGLDEQNKILDVAMKDRIRLQAELDEATKLVSVATANRDNAARIFNFAENHEQFVAAWRQKVDGDLPEPISNSKLQIAAAEADIAREAIETAQIVRKAKEHIAEAEKRDKEAESAKEQAEKLRQAAQAVDSVLSGIVAQSGVPLQIEPINGQMRLTVAAGDRRGGRECFAEMSEGERWRMALDIAIKAVGSGGMITIPQNAFEGLDPVNRAAIAQQLEAGGVIAFTAEASEGELRAELYNGVAP